MREATDRTTTANLLFRGYTNADLWVDDVTLLGRRHRRGRHHAAVCPALEPGRRPPADTGGAINVSWPAATDNVGVTGYKLYRGTTPGIYGAPTALGNVTTYTDATAVTGTRYYYARLSRRRRRQRGCEVAGVLGDRARQLRTGP